MRTFPMTLCRLLVFALSALALPAGAQVQKLYGLFMTVPLGVVTPDGQQVVATIKNMAPPSQASSNIGSLQLNVATAFAGLRIQKVESVQKLDKNGHAINTSFTLTPLSAYPTSGIAITGIGQNIKAQESIVITMDVNGCGVASKFDPTWTAQVFTGTSLNGSQFIPSPNPLPLAQVSTDIPCATVACGDPTVIVSRTDLNSPAVPITRGPFNSDGTCSVGSSGTRIFVNNDLGLNPQRVQLQWPIGSEADSQPEAAFRFDANVNITNVARLSWKDFFSGATDTNLPAYLDIAANPALMCSAPNSTGDWFPRPYGNLTASVAKSDKKIKVSPTGVAWPTTFPRNLIIDDELMIVTAINTSNNTWTVTRLAGAVAHASGAPVMYTPLNRLTSPVACSTTPGSANPCPYSVGDLAKACLVPTSVDGAYGIIGIGDPIWSGGNL